MKRTPLSLIAHWAGGEIHGEDTAIDAISNDTRTLAPGSLYVALRGERFTYEGRDVHVTPSPRSPGGPVLAYGGHSVAAARRAGRRGTPGRPAEPDGHHHGVRRHEGDVRAGRVPGDR